MRKNEFSNLILVLPDKDDVERNLVEVEWKKHNGKTLRIGRFWEPPVLDVENVRLYGNNIFCLILAEKLGIRLISPEDDFIFKIDYSWLKRRMSIASYADIDKVEFPSFIKPLVPKLFMAKVYQDLQELKIECKGLEEETRIIISEEVIIESEVRAFVLNDKIETLAFYEGNGDIEQAKSFLDNFIAENEEKLPVTLVIDVGYIKDRGWAVIETNAAWGAGLNGCEPFAVARCIEKCVQV